MASATGTSGEEGTGAGVRGNSQLGNINGRDPQGSEDNDGSRSILVSNIPEGLNEDKLQIHFMRSLNGGGDIESITMLTESEAKITYLDSAAVERVLGRPQVMKGVEVRVQKWTPPKDNTQCGAIVVEDNRSILVSDLPEGVNMDKLEIHFMRSSNGGGEIESITMVTETAAKITYLDAAAVETVLGRPHVFNGIHVTVKKWHPEEDDEEDDPEVFDKVHATIGPQIAQLIPPDEMDKIKEETGIMWEKDIVNEVITIKGTYTQVADAQELLQIWIQQVVMEQNSEQLMATAKGSTPMAVKDKKETSKATTEISPDSDPNKSKVRGKIRVTALDSDRPDDMSKGYQDKLVNNEIEDGVSHGEASSHQESTGSTQNDKEDEEDKGTSPQRVAIIVDQMETVHAGEGEDDGRQPKLTEEHEEDSANRPPADEERTSMSDAEQNKQGIEMGSGTSNEKGSPRGNTTRPEGIRSPTTEVQPEQIQEEEGVQEEMDTDKDVAVPDSVDVEMPPLPLSENDEPMPSDDDVQETQTSSTKVPPDSSKGDSYANYQDNSDEPEGQSTTRAEPRGSLPDKDEAQQTFTHYDHHNASHNDSTSPDSSLADKVKELSEATKEEKGAFCSEKMNTVDQDAGDNNIARSDPSGDSPPDVDQQTLNHADRYKAFHNATTTPDSSPTGECDDGKEVLGATKGEKNVFCTETVDNVDHGAGDKSSTTIGPKTGDSHPYEDQDKEQTFTHDDHHEASLSNSTTPDSSLANKVKKLSGATNEEKEAFRTENKDSVDHATGDKSSTTTGSRSGDSHPDEDQEQQTFTHSDEHEASPSDSITRDSSPTDESSNFQQCSDGKEVSGATNGEQNAFYAQNLNNVDCKAEEKSIITNDPRSGGSRTDDEDQQNHDGHHKASPNDPTMANRSQTDEAKEVPAARNVEKKAFYTEKVMKDKKPSASSVVDDLPGNKHEEHREDRSKHSAGNTGPKQEENPPAEVLVDPEVLSYIRHMYHSEISDIGKRCKAVFHASTDNKKASFVPSPALGKDPEPEKAMDEFITLYQQVFNKIKCEYFDVGQYSLAPTFLLDGLRKVRQLHPEVVTRGNDTDTRVTFLGEPEKIRAARTALCGLLGISVSRGSRRRGNNPPASTESAGSRTDAPKGAQGGENSPVLLYTHTFNQGLEVKVAYGSITSLPVDAIVNAADAKLRHGGGVAKAIVQAGGDIIQKESTEKMKKRGFLKPTETEVTGAGRLPCKHVIHAHGPKWQESQAKECTQMLKQTCINILQAAEGLKAESVAIPAISSGKYGMPKHICAQALLYGVLEYLSTKQMSSSHLKCIWFIDMAEETIQVLADVFASEISAHQSSPSGKANYKPTVKPTGGANQFQASSPPKVKTYAAAAAAASGKPKSSSSSGHPHRNDSTQVAALLNPEKGPGYAQQETQDRSSMQKVAHGAAGGANSSASGTVTKDNKSGQPKTGEDKCPICLSAPTNPKSLPCKDQGCKAVFCKKCLDQALASKSCCPVCNAVVGKLMGNQPEGRMKVSYNRQLRLAGYQAGAIIIDYVFKDGIQGPEHPNPGKPYKGTTRTAYLPYNNDGKQVLHLLQQSFGQRLTFTIGTSSTTGCSNTVVWNDIHHKTNPYGGPSMHGYPDHGYLKRVTEELAAKGIK